MILYKFSVNDGSDTAEITLFNNKYLAGKIVVGKKLPVLRSGGENAVFV